MESDVYFMNRALELAKKAEGQTSPNPIVGAIIVKKGKVIGQGYHKKAGSEHAEINAFNNAKESIEGATLYVSLEPCCHFGQTPPCVDKIIKEKIARVVIAVCDPNPLVNGKSVKKLRLAGVKVKVGVCENQAQKINEVFFLNMKEKRPFVAAKVAQSLDGKIATSTGKSKWITSLAARRYAKKLRDKYGAVLVGVNTVVKDNPQLNGIKNTSYKIVIDPQLRIPKKSYLVKKSNQQLVIVTSEKNKDKSLLLPKPIKFVFVESGKKGLSLKEALKKLYLLGVSSVFVEGGADTLGRFFDAQLVDKFYCFVAPKILGGKNALTSIGGQGVSNVNKSVALKDVKLNQIGQDFLVESYIKYK